MIIKLREEQKQVFIKHKTNIYTEAHYFALQIGHKYLMRIWIPMVLYIHSDSSSRSLNVDEHYKIE